MTGEITGAEAPASGSEFQAGLSEELRGNASLADFKDTDALANAYLSTKKMVGNSVRIPGEDASDQDRADFRQKMLDSNAGLMVRPDTTDVEAMGDLFNSMGRPEEAAGYSEVEGLVGDRFTQIAGLAHEAGVSDAQFQKVMGPLIAADVEVAQQVEATRATGIAELKVEWGDAYADKATRAMNTAKATNAPAELQQALADNKANAAVLKWLDGLAASLGQEGSQLAEQLGSIAEDTRGELESQRDELTRKMINDTLAPGEYERLQKKLLAISEKLAA